MNLTGGLAWHWLAWRSKARWAPTSQAIEKWLLSDAQATHARQTQTQTQTQTQAQPSLLLIGASAGWMMSSQWLQQFARVDTFDIDPWSALLFKRRHGKALQATRTELHCHTRDALQDLPALLSEHPQACVFFDNVLGQLRFQSSAADWQQVERRLKQLKVQLKGREWGSLHDRMSGQTTQHIATTSDLPVRHPDWHDQHWLTHLKAQSPWLDHLTQDVFPTGVSVKDFGWNFSSNYRHWLQAGWVRP
jgi:hypothetical protein